MNGRSRMTVDPRISKCLDGARRVFTDQANIKLGGGGGGQPRVREGRGINIPESARGTTTADGRGETRQHKGGRGRGGRGGGQPRVPKRRSNHTRESDARGTTVNFLSRGKQQGHPPHNEKSRPATRNLTLSETSTTRDKHGRRSAHSSEQQHPSHPRLSPLRHSACHPFLRSSNPNKAKYLLPGLSPDIRTHVRGHPRRAWLGQSKVHARYSLAKLCQSTHTSPHNRGGPELPPLSGVLLTRRKDQLSVATGTVVAETGAVARRS